MAGDVLAAKALYDARVKEIDRRRARLYVGSAGNESRRAAIAEWAGRAEEMAAVAYDVVRFDVQACGATRPDIKAHCEAESKRMAERYQQLAAALSEREAAIA